MNAVARAPAAARAALTSPVSALRERLEELTRLVLTLPADVYCARPSQVSGSIGQHVRHVLDHVSSLVAACPSTVLNYDHRSRGTAVETEPSAAVREMMRLDAALERWDGRPLDEPISVAAVMSTEGHSVIGWSTLGRELAFVISHTIHHQALVAMLLEHQGSAPPSERFGYAPSTPLQS